ncbi:immune inhibitor A domain-containing protein, partial [Streptomyces tubercidicus]
AYQNGLLIWLWDTSMNDNNVSAHPGAGKILPIDAHSKPLLWKDGTLQRNRVQAYDSTFSKYRTDGITLHKNGVTTKIPSKAGNPVFDDKNKYWYSTNPTGGVKVSPTNTRIAISSEAKDGSTITIKVGPSKK